MMMMVVLLLMMMMLMLMMMMMMVMLLHVRGARGIMVSYVAMAKYPLFTKRF